MTNTEKALLMIINRFLEEEYKYLDTRYTMETSSELKYLDADRLDDIRMLQYDIKKFVESILEGSTKDEG